MLFSVSSGLENITGEGEVTDIYLYSFQTRIGYMIQNYSISFVDQLEQKLKKKRKGTLAMPNKSFSFTSERVRKVFCVCVAYLMLFS